MTRIKAWVEAARPKTLTASFSPVLLGTALAFHDNGFRLFPALLCLLVAMLAQVASNFANDYFDYKKGADRADRLGPARAVASGWISPRAMLYATLGTLALACFFGTFLLYYGGWELIGVGMAIVLFALAYTAGPFPLAYNGLGDVCVLIFFGIIPVCFTYYVQAQTCTLDVFLLSLALGFLSVNILVVNNYRDYEQDKLSSKHTTIVLFGKKFGLLFYLFNCLLALIFAYPVWKVTPYSGVALCLCIILFFSTWYELKTVMGAVLNRTLARTARNVFLYAVMLSLFLMFF